MPTKIKIQENDFTVETPKRKDKILPLLPK